MESVLISNLLLGGSIFLIALFLVTPNLILAATPQQKFHRHNVVGYQLFQAHDVRVAITDFHKGLVIACSQNNSGLAAVMQANLRNVGASE